MNHQGRALHRGILAQSSALLWKHRNCLCLPVRKEILKSKNYLGLSHALFSWPPFWVRILDSSLDLTSAFMKDRARKAEALKWRVLNHARQRTGPAPATLSIIFMFYVLSVMTYISELWVCRAVTNFLLKQRSSLSGPFRYLEHVRKIHRKFSRSLRKHFQPKTIFENKAQNQVGIF